MIPQDYGSKQVEAVLTAVGRRALAFQTLGRKSKVMALQFSSYLTNPAAPASHLPRMKLVWGHDKAQHQIIADIPPYMSLALVGSSVSIEVWSDQDDILTPTAQTVTTPVYHLNASFTEEGSLTSTPLTYTTRAHTLAAAFTEVLPPGAVEVSTVHVGNITPAFGAALPPGYLAIGGIHAGGGAGGVQVYQRFDVNEILNRPQPLYPLARMVALGNSTGFEIANNYCNFLPQNGYVGNTETFRIIYGLRV